MFRNNGDDDNFDPDNNGSYEYVADEESTVEDDIWTLEKLQQQRYIQQEMEPLNSMDLPNITKNNDKISNNDGGIKIGTIHVLNCHKNNQNECDSVNDFKAVKCIEEDSKPWAKTTGMLNEVNHGLEDHGDNVVQGQIVPPHHNKFYVVAKG